MIRNDDQMSSNESKNESKEKNNSLDMSINKSAKRVNKGADTGKVVAEMIKNAEFQEKRDGDLAVLFFKQSCPYCRDFKPTWNRVAKELKKRWSRGSVVYDEEEQKIAKCPPVRRMDVAKFSNVQKTIKFPSVPTIALYKRGKPVVFVTTQDRSLPNMLKIVENYYKRNELPPDTDHVIGTVYGTWPEKPEEKQEAPPVSKVEKDMAPPVEVKKYVAPPLTSVRKHTPTIHATTVATPAAAVRKSEKQSSKILRPTTSYADPVKNSPPLKQSNPGHVKNSPAKSGHVKNSPAKSGHVKNSPATLSADKKLGVADDIFAKLLVKLVKNKDKL
jgi:thiol-disulfide isomerase/thioredoxin